MLPNEGDISRRERSIPPQWYWSWGCLPKTSSALKYHKLMVEAQRHTFDMLVLLRNYRKGADPDGLQQLLNRDLILAELVPDKSKVTLKELDALQERLLFRLSETRRLLDQLEPELELYRKQVVELDKLTQGATSNLVKANVAIIIWSRAHHRLATGVTDPAKIDLMGITKAALDAALPY